MGHKFQAIGFTLAMCLVTTGGLFAQLSMAAAQGTPKDLSASSPLIRDGRHIADMVARVHLQFDGTTATGSFGNTITGRQEGRVFTRPEGGTNGPWVDLLFVDGNGGVISSIQNQVEPIWECGQTNSQIVPSSHDTIQIAISPSDWSRLVGIQITPHGAWREEHC